MPELPEVETVRDGLDRHVVGGVVRDVQVLREYSVRRHAAGPADLVGRLTGTRLAAAVRRGKYLWLPLDPPPGAAREAVGAGLQNDDGAHDEALFVHLGMSGQLLVSEADGRDTAADADGAGTAAAARHRHLRVRVLLEMPDGAARHLDFVDQRTFGHLSVADLEPTPDGLPGGLGSPAATVPVGVGHVGRDLLDPHLDVDAVVRAVRLRRSGIKRILLDQTLTSGIGNIYADEALWRARTHPERPGASMRPADVRAVLDAARDVMTAALAVGGTSFDALYVNVNGESGYFARGLAAYGRAGQPCSRCGTPIERTTFMNRSSHVCPACQRRPRAGRRV